ncbi:MAG: S1 family peptidase [Acidobacteriia bacterium]|nr:S1 family peptidase [Terriglobia bacterium]
MGKISCLLFGVIVLIGAVGCGGGGSSTPAPTPTPSKVFPNDEQLAQVAPVKLGTSGGNANDLGTKFCCIGTLGSLWTHVGTTNPVILSNNHVLDRSGLGAAGEAINQPLQLACTATGAPPPLTVAHLTQGAALKPVANETTGPCATDASKAALCGHAPSNVDAAFAEIVPGQVELSGAILDLGPVGATNISPAAPSATIGAPSLGEPVGKSGRTTGLTCSTIQSLNDTILINYEGKCGDTSNGIAPAFTAYFNNQVTISGGSFSAGGDSGSLVVDTNTSRPVGLLYGGNNLSTVANPIQDVITAFGGPAAFSIVGGGDHAVSCAKTASAAGTQVGTAQSALVPSELQRVKAVQQRRAQSLMRDFGVASVQTGASADNPNEGALMIHISGKSIPAIPPVIDGVRTRLVFDDPSALAQLPQVSAKQLQDATAIKEAHVSEFLGKGIQGIGVAVSGDNPAETAIAIFVIKGAAHPAIPATLDGVRTRVFEGDLFKAY